MKEFGAIFYKEFLETHLETLTFLIAGLLFPFFATFNRWYYVDDIDTARFVMGGIVATWLNLTVLCATAFAREREAGTMETLRRTSPDWRVAAAGKFGYAFLSTLALGVFFFFVTLCVDMARNLRLTTTFASFFTTDSGYDLSVFLKGSGLGAAFCWGVFWTGRASRQISAIFLAFFSTLACGIVLTATLRALGARYETIVDLVSLAVGLVALALAPLGDRFGYRRLNVPFANADETGAEVDKRAPGANRVLDPRNPKLKNSKPSAFFALFRHALAQTALIFRSPASILFEVAAVVLLYIAVRNRLNSLNVYNESHSLLLFVLFCAALGSGLFADVKSKGALLKERLNVGFWRYWLVNAFAALVVVLVFCLGVFLFTDFHFPFNLVYVMAPSAALLFGLILWSASALRGRLVATACAFVLFIATIVGCFAAVGFVGSLLYISISYVVGLVLTVASVAIVAARFKGKKTGLVALTPIALIVIMFVAIGWRERVQEAQRSGLPEKILVAPQDCLRNAPTFKNEKEYEKFVEQTRQNLEVVPLGTPSSDVADSPQWQDVAKAVERTENAFALTKKFAAGSGEAEAAEKNLYDVLRRSFVRSYTSEPYYKPVLEILEKVKETRPTGEEIAANRYVYLSALGRPATPSFYLNTLLQNRRKYYAPAIDAALWNATASAGSRGKFVDATLYEYLPTSFVPQNSLRPADLPLAFGTASLSTFDDALASDEAARRVEWSPADVYNALLRAFDVDCSAVPLEIQRRLIYLTLAARKTGVPSGFQTPQSYGEIAARLDSDPLCVPRPQSQTKEGVVAKNVGSVKTLFDPSANETSLLGFYPLVTGQSFTAPVVSPQHERLLNPFTNADGSQLTIPDGRKAFRSSVVTTVAVDVALGPFVDRNGVKVEPQTVGLLRTLFTLYDDKGAPLLDASGAEYVGCEYNAVDWRGEPVYFLLEPLDEEPPFNRDGLELYNGYGDSGVIISGSNPPELAKKPFVSRVRVVKLFDRKGENSFVADDLWFVHQNPQTPEENDVAPNKEPASVGKFVDSEGKEVLDRDGNPKYALKTGAFLNKRHVNKPNFHFVFDLPEGIAKNADKLRVVYSTGCGTYVDVKSDVVSVENGRVYSKVPAVGLAASSSWYLNPSLDPDKVQALSDESPVLVVEPLNIADQWSLQ